MNASGQVMIEMLSGHLLFQHSFMANDNIERNTLQ